METLNTVDPELEITGAESIPIAACERVVESGKEIGVGSQGRIGRRAVGQAGECHLGRLVVGDGINDFSICRHWLVNEKEGERGAGLLVTSHI